jgi:predicted transcriptional regulator
VNSCITEKTPKRRDKLGIIAEILEIAKDGTLKTQIMYKANLSFAQLNVYLEFMLKIRLLGKFVSGGRVVYRTTEKGLDYLGRSREIMALLEIESEKGVGGAMVPFQKLGKKSQRAF